MKKLSIGPRLLAALVLAWGALGCGSRPSYWDSVPTTAASYGLSNGVALVDNSDHRVVILTARGDQQIATRPFPVGHNVISAASSPDGLRLFVLSTGDWPRRTTNDQYPMLTVVDASGFDTQSSMYEMAAPLPSLAIDPVGQWAVAYAGAGAPASFIENASELVIFDLTKPGSKPRKQNIQSYGGTPQRLTFTPPLKLPGGKGQRRLLIIETDIDVTLLELDNPSVQVTIPLTSGTSGQQVQPAGVVVDGFDSNSESDSRIALRASANRNVFTFLLGPSDTNDFTPIINVIDVGGVPSDIAFVHADNGVLRVAALVPSISSAVLADPDTSITERDPLPASYSRLSLITSVVGSASGSAGTDVAMLWNATSATSSGVAFWSLATALGQSYASVQPIAVSRPIATVDDVAAQDNLKVLETADGTGFFVLDLHKGTAAPLQASDRATLSVAPDGKRLWAFVQGGTDLAMVAFNDLNPVPLKTDKPIDAVYDVARPPSAGGGRSLVAIHKQGTVGVTVFDATTPDTATSQRVPALLLEGP
jgi:hypothetical protein